MSATLVVRHGCTGDRVLRLPENTNDVLVTHDFPSVEQASSFAHSPVLQTGMQRAGVAGPPQVEIFDVA